MVCPQRPLNDEDGGKVIIHPMRSKMNIKGFYIYGFLICFLFIYFVLSGINVADIFASGGFHPAGRSAIYHK